jgi:hypothetical protein
MTTGDFDIAFATLMQSAANYFSQQGYLKRKIRILECRIEKYQESRNPIRPLLSIGSISELRAYENVHLYVRLKSDGREESFFGNFFVDASGTLVSEGFDDVKTDIDPREVADETRLKDRAIAVLTEYREEIWDAVKFLVNIVLGAMRVQPY